MRYNATAYVTAVLAIGLMGCSVNTKTNETAGPKVVFRQGDSTIADLFLTPDSATPASFAPETFACVATDPGGVKSISLSYSDTTTLCVFSGGCGTLTSFCIGDGATFHISPSMPAPQSATSHPDSSGQVPNELFLLSTLQGGPYECAATKDKKTVRGEPFGQTVKATCSATNYSGKSSTSILPVIFNPQTGNPSCTGSACNCVGSPNTLVTVCSPGYVCQSDGSCQKPPKP